MKLVSIACPHCGARLQASPNAKMLTCDYCNGEFMVDDEVKRFHLQDAEQAGYEFEKGRRRAMAEAEQAEKQAVLEAERKAAESRRKAAMFVWITCPYCEKDSKVKKDFTYTACEHCGRSINVQLGANIRWAMYHERMEDYRQAVDFYIKAHKIDPNNSLVKSGIERINKKDSYAFIRMEVPDTLNRVRSLDFKYGFLIYQDSFYFYDDMKNIGHDANSFWFEYPGYVGQFRFSSEAPAYICKCLVKAKQGIYK